MVRLLYIYILFEFFLKCSADTENSPIEVIVNYDKIDTKATLDKQADYNKIGEYWYQEGEVALITCVKQHGHKINLNYNITCGDNMKCQSIFNRYEYSTAQYLEVKLTEKLNGSYLTCNVQTSYSTYTVRLYFYTMIAHIGDARLQIQVNDLNLVPIKMDLKPDLILRYQYKYVHGETLAIKSSSINPNEKWNCFPKEDSAQLNPIIYQHDGINLTVTLPYGKMASTFFKCDVGNTTVILKLFPKYSLLIGPVLGGLSSAGTLLIYGGDSLNYIFILYSNSQKQNLNLTCSWVHLDCKWVKGDQEVIDDGASEFLYIPKIKRFRSHYLLTPLQNVSSTNIKCECDSHSRIIDVEIIKERFEPKAKPQITGSTYSEDKVNGHDSIWYIIVTVSTVVGVLVTAVIAAIVRRKITATSQIASARIANGDAGNGAGISDPVYESVDCDYVTCGQPGSASSTDIASRPRCSLPPEADEGSASSTNISSRPPCPLPPEADEGNKKYVHYDTVYEERFRRMWMLYQLRIQARRSN